MESIIKRSKRNNLKSGHNERIPRLRWIWSTNSGRGGWEATTWAPIHGTCKPLSVKLEQGDSLVLGQLSRHSQRHLWLQIQSQNLCLWLSSTVARCSPQYLKSHSGLTWASAPFTGMQFMSLSEHYSCQTFFSKTSRLVGNSQRVHDSWGTKKNRSSAT